MHVHPSVVLQLDYLLVMRFMTRGSMFIEHTYKFRCRKYHTAMENEGLDAILFGHRVLDSCVLDLCPSLGSITQPCESVTHSIAHIINHFSPLKGNII